MRVASDTVPLNSIATVAALETQVALLQSRPAAESPTPVPTAPAGIPELTPIPTPTPARVILVVTATPTPGRAAGLAVYTDPVSYCEAQGTLDWPVGRRPPLWQGPDVPPVVARAMPPGVVGVWRCYRGKVLVCATDAVSPRCSKRLTSREPDPLMGPFCSGSLVSGMATRGYSIWEWECRNGVPVPGRQWLQVDDLGFVSNEWTVIN